MINLINTRIEKLVFGGQGLARINGRAAFIWNALPGETVAAAVSKSKPSYCEGTAVKIIKAAPERIAPVDHHFLDCSPWQIMAPAAENYWKKEIAREVYRRIGGLTTPADLAIISATAHFYRYRHKMEFALAGQRPGEIFLAHSQRQSHRARPIPGCSLLARPAQQTADQVLTWLNQEKIEPRLLKSLVVQATQAGQTSSALYVKKRINPKHLPQLTEPWSGFYIGQSSPQSPANTVSEKIKQVGSDYLEEKLGSKKFRYGRQCFFQINPPLFEQALNDMKLWIKNCGPLIDFYAGIGAIGLSLQQKGQALTLIENLPEATKYARQNIDLNHSENVQVINGAAENARDYLTAGATAIFDPPRAGLHPELIKKIISARPAKIIYLSCNLATHARDLKFLLSRYRLEFLRLYNFFPRTPHIESLAILSRTV